MLQYDAKIKEKKNCCLELCIELWQLAASPFSFDIRLPVQIYILSGKRFCCPKSLGSDKPGIVFSDWPQLSKVLDREGSFLAASSLEALHTGHSGIFCVPSRCSAAVLRFLPECTTVILYTYISLHVEN